MQLRLPRGAALAASASALEASGRPGGDRAPVDLPADHYLHRTAPTEW